MALNGYLRLTIDGSPLTGDVTMASIGGIDVSTDHVEVLELRVGVVVAGANPGDARQRARREFLPVQMTKPLDRTTPRLVEAASRGREVDASFLLFDNDPDSGETRHRFTIRLEQARITAVTTQSPDRLDPASANRPATDDVELVARSFAWVDEVHGVEFEDDDRR